MRRISTTNRAVDLHGAGKHGWKNGVPGTSDRPTEGEAAWFNAVQEEISNVIEGLGVDLNPLVNSQLYDAIFGYVESATLLMNRANGFYGDDIQNDTAAFNSACAAVSLVGGGVLRAPRGKTFGLTSDVLVAPGVRVDLNGSTVNFAWASGADVSGFRMRSNTAIYGGTINGAGLGEPTSANKDLHCPVCVGESGGSLAGYNNVTIRDLTITNNRSGTIGGRGVLIQAASSNFRIENLTFPDSSTIGCCVQVSWAGPGGNPPATSQHPYNGVIRNIKIGTMTKAGSSFDVAAIDIVGAYNITIENVEVDAWAGDAVLQVRVGGFGATVCDPAIAPLLFKNIVCRNFTVKLCSQHGALVNGRANDAVGTPTYSVPAKIENFTAVGPGASSAYYGARALHCGDAEFNNCNMSYFDRGAYIEENTRRVKINGGAYHHNNEQGIAVVHSTGPKDIAVRWAEVYLNGQDGTSQAGIYAEGVDGLTVEDNILNDETNETGQDFGLRVVDTCTRVKVRNNYGRSVKTGGNVYVIGSTNSYRVLESYQNNRCHPRIKTAEIYAGVNILTEQTYSDSGGGYPVRQCRARNSAIPPTAGTWHRGDMIYHWDHSASTSMGEACVTPGTFSSFTDNTGDTTNGSSVITGMTSTSGLLAGEYVTLSAGFSSTGPFKVLSVDSAAQITVDATATSTQANITIATPDPVFKAMPALAA